jgi:uncharacterized OB-fold protein
VTGWLAPTMTTASKPFWDGLAEGELRLPYCQACESFFFPPRRWCPNCWTDQLEWRKSAGWGVVWSRTRVHVPFQGVRPGDVPYTALLVDLAEGVRIPALLDGSSDDVSIGDRVEFCSIPGQPVTMFGNSNVGSAMQPSRPCRPARSRRS